MKKAAHYKKPSQLQRVVHKKEAEIQREILHYLKWKKYTHWRNYVGPIVHGYGAKRSYSKNHMAGLPDILGIFKNKPGQLFGIEIKSKTGKLSTDQKLWLKRLEDSGVYVMVVRSLDTVIKLLEEREASHARDSKL